MALTRADAEEVLVSRLSGLLAAAGMAVTYDGSNADLADPLAWALRRMGTDPASPVTVTDGDLSGLGAADYDDYLDLAEYRTLQTIQGHLAVVDITAGPRTEKLSQLAAQVKAMIEAKAASLAEYVTSVACGYIRLDLTDDYG